ncbi:MAG: FxLYD domain-containing protein [Acidobacteria bacterium]|nr:FxLYD domain-containing protein [Acidobacteriota bacterium]MCY3963705.1 FxLYD domain-containing protein [Acidobacteriota bacterium]
MKKILVPMFLILALAACDDFRSPAGVGEGAEGSGHSESGESGGELGESGNRYNPGDTAYESRQGVDLVMSHYRPGDRFEGTITNTTGRPISNVRVEIHLSNGTELGPTPNVTLAAGEMLDVELDAAGQSFAWWSVHVEIGSSGS